MVDRIHENVDYKALADHYIIRDGYVFLPMTYPYNVFDAVLIRCPQSAICTSPQLPRSERSLDEHLALINELKLEKALIIGNNIDFIKKCPSLKHLKIIPSDDAGNNFDYSPLYHMPEIKSLWCATIYGSKEEFSTTVDYSKINGIEKFSIYNSGCLNYNHIPTVKSLGLSGFQGQDLQNAFSSLQLDTLSVIQCKVQSLEGIQRSEKMQCLYLYYNRFLKDISALSKVRETLTALRIENCPKITDFSVLGELENLELLELSGSNELPNLEFLKKMKNLKTFIFSINVKDGDLSPCLGLSYVYSGKNRKHYNLKDTELPKVQYVRGNETIEEWRRLE